MHTSRKERGGGGQQKTTKTLTPASSTTPRLLLSLFASARPSDRLLVFGEAIRGHAVTFQPSGQGLQYTLPVHTAPKARPEARAKAPAMHSIQSPESIWVYLLTQNPIFMPGQGHGRTEAGPTQPPQSAGNKTLSPPPQPRVHLAAPPGLLCIAGISRASRGCTENAPKIMRSCRALQQRQMQTGPRRKKKLFDCYGPWRLVPSRLGYASAPLPPSSARRRKKKAKCQNNLLQGSGWGPAAQPPAALRLNIEAFDVGEKIACLILRHFCDDAPRAPLGSSAAEN